MTLRIDLAATGALLSLLVLNMPAEASARRGLAIVQKNCATCHAIGRTGDSRYAKAPPFREVVKKYPLENLEEALAEGIVVSHEAPEMPAFTMEPREIADVIDYLNTLRPAQRK